MSPKLKLIYFDGKGRAEPIRLALSIGKVDFEEERVNFDEFVARKKSGEFMYGKMPVLEVDGEQLAESSALLRYCGRLSGTYPEDPISACLVDEVMSALDDLTRPFVKSGQSQEPEKIKEGRRYAVENSYPSILTGLEKRWTTNTKGPFLLGSDVSVADLFAFVFYSLIHDKVMDYITEEDFAGCPSLKKVYEAVLDIPEVKQYYASK
eukprot:Plantae.Rhodophyta-Purpureofilum_apyrenoidigerum.ctg3459.p1 GENE.Plantae.Rhodophyta-Purpureofilum_apyrenoidigerum.ctg3459~~Plantae.Rhodophyta-Purpureofilum_apyrenoidigerum.ctg3459.p1  ORF type:complete len:208 (+),score=37.29 Plantae.Rhodophyta-Purpureofilum_apyrenoidigerum.ctg3459:352-975(+)